MGYLLLLPENKNYSFLSRHAEIPAMSQMLLPNRCGLLGGEGSLDRAWVIIQAAPLPYIQRRRRISIQWKETDPRVWLATNNRQDTTCRTNQGQGASRDGSGPTLRCFTIHPIQFASITGLQSRYPSNAVHHSSIRRGVLICGTTTFARGNGPFCGIEMGPQL